MAKKIPRFIASMYANGARGFRAEHRKRVKVLLAACHQARRGCAYSPAYKHLQAAESEILKALEAVRVKNWEGSTDQIGDKP